MVLPLKEKDKTLVLYFFLFCLVTCGYGVLRNRQFCVFCEKLKLVEGK